VQAACVTSDPVMQQHVNHRAFGLELAQHSSSSLLHFSLAGWMGRVFFEVAENHFLRIVSIMKN